MYHKHIIIHKERNKHLKSLSLKIHRILRGRNKTCADDKSGQEINKRQRCQNYENKLKIKCYETWIINKKSSLGVK